MKLSLSSLKFKVKLAFCHVAHMQQVKLCKWILIQTHRNESRYCLIYTSFLESALRIISFWLDRIWLSDCRVPHASAEWFRTTSLVMATRTTAAVIHRAGSDQMKPTSAGFACRFWLQWTQWPMCSTEQAVAHSALWRSSAHQCQGSWQWVYDDLLPDMPIVVMRMWHGPKMPEILRSCYSRAVCVGRKSHEPHTGSTTHAQTCECRSRTVRGQEIRFEWCSSPSLPMCSICLSNFLPRYQLSNDDVWIQRSESRRYYRPK